MAKYYKEGLAVSRDVLDAEARLKPDYPFSYFVHVPTAAIDDETPLTQMVEDLANSITTDWQMRVVMDPDSKNTEGKMLEYTNWSYAILADEIIAKLDFMHENDRDKFAKEWKFPK